MRADGDDVPLTGTFLHNCPMSDMLIDEFDSEILSCRCFYSVEFFNAQDARAVALDLLRAPHTEATHMSPLKLKLLDKYATKEPTAFIQIDGFAPDQCDGIISDCGGYGLTSGEVHELMSGGSPVRILVRPGTDPLLVSKILKGADDAYPLLCRNYGESYSNIANYVRLMTPTQREILVEFLRAMRFGASERDAKELAQLGL